MSVQEVIGKVGAKVLGVGRAILQADDAADRAEELEHLRGEYARLDDQLATMRGEAALLLQRIADNETVAASLPAEVESSLRRAKSAQALRQALELERVRHELEADRAEVKRNEHEVWCLEFRLRQLSRTIERLSSEGRAAQ